MRRLIFAFLFAAAAIAQTPVHYVQLAWMDTVNPAGTLYQVYRMTGACPAAPVIASPPPGFTLLTTTAIPATSYTDSTVAGGATYCWAFVSVTASGGESAPSGTVQVTVPTLFPPQMPAATRIF